MNLAHHRGTEGCGLAPSLDVGPNPSLWYSVPGKGNFPLKEVPPEAVAKAIDLNIHAEKVTSIHETTIYQPKTGYATVGRVRICVDKRPGEKTLITKRVVPPTGKSDADHTRKLRSYQAEKFFYEFVAPRLLATGRVIVPTPYHVQSEDSGKVTLLLSDLSKDFPQSDSGHFNVKQAQAALDWLAGFHAQFWECATSWHSPTSKHAAKGGVWPQGGFWHLDTRRGEFDSLGPQWKRIRASAEAVDSRLKGAGTKKFRTLCHGDFKSANILLSADGTKAAAHDFQYVGEGYGAKDVVMLLHSSLRHSKDEEPLLRHYHAKLAALLGGKGKGYTFEVMMKHYELCVVDYARYLASAGFEGTDPGWTERMAYKVLDKLDGGSATSPASYEQGIKKVFPIDK